MGRLLDRFKIEMSHQEMDRIVSEIETLHKQFCLTDEGPTGVEWLPVLGIAHAICEELGYEDEAELEDALHGSFSQFLDALPHIEKKVQDGKEYFKITPDPPQSEWQPSKLVLKVTSRSDLGRVCLKSGQATIEIPELEFEISRDGKRKIDTIYNHIAAAVFNLGQHVAQNTNMMSSDHAVKIMETVEQLNILLDVATPFTWIVHDPSGTSEIKPDQGVVVEEYER